jgi:hypothetical protein
LSEFRKPPRLNKSPAQLRHSCISNASLRRLYNFVNKSLSRPEAKGKPLVDCRQGYAEFPGCAGFSSRFLFVHTCHRCRTVLAFAQWLGAPPPPQISEQQAREAAGEDAVYYGTKLSGASNEKAKRTFGFRPRRLQWLDRSATPARPPSA